MKVNKLSLSLILIILLQIPTLQAEEGGGGMSPKGKAFLTVAGYGAGGGALLGLASMAFGTSPRAIAQGASLGLYAGLIFGTYVLVSHQQQNNAYYDEESPYQEEGEQYYDDDDSSNLPPTSSNSFVPSVMNQYMQVKLQERIGHGDLYRAIETKQVPSALPITVQFVQLQF